MRRLKVGIHAGKWRRHQRRFLWEREPIKDLGDLPIDCSMSAMAPFALAIARQRRAWPIHGNNSTTATCPAITPSITIGTFCPGV